MNKQVHEVVSPRGKAVVTEKQGPAPRLDTLEGKTVCEIWNASFAGDVTFPIIEKMLRERYPDVKVIPYTEFPWTTIDSLRGPIKAKMLGTVRAALVEKGCDAVITGNGG